MKNMQTFEEFSEENIQEARKKDRLQLSIAADDMRNTTARWFKKNSGAIIRDIQNEYDGFSVDSSDNWGIMLLSGKTYSQADMKKMQHYAKTVLDRYKEGRPSLGIEVTQGTRVEYVEI